MDKECENNQSLHEVVADFVSIRDGDSFSFTAILWVNRSWLWKGEND
jgi:hypothetical protein